ncbi:MAG: phage tail sheath family protein [Oscillospiraceae bacterium]|nr:phage tail sheath family protein [Oscillospiraceae bacterium]
MAGGTFTARNKVRPGAYINFTSAAKPLGTVGERGTALLPMNLSYGPVGEMVAITADTDVRLALGIDSGAEELADLRECAKRAEKVLVWRLCGGRNAGFSGNGMTVTARWPGSGGNKISVVISGSEAPYEVQVLLDGRAAESFSAAEGSEIDSRLVKITGTLSPSAGITLTGGTSDSPAVEDFEAMFEAAALTDFHVLGMPFFNSLLVGMAVDFVKEMRGKEGVMVQAVVPDTAADHEGVISVKNGVILEDGRALSNVKAVAYVAGMMAGTAVNRSCTYDRYDGAVDANPRMKESEIIDALKKGHLVFTARKDRVIVEKDQNTLVSFTSEKGEAFSKNRVIRVLDMLAGDVKRIFEEHYLGRASNSADGRRLYQAELIAYLRQLIEMSAIEEPESGDVVVSAGSASDEVIVELAVQPVDSMEKLYMTVTVG